MRHLLLRLLLISVCFSTLLGIPLHAMDHMQASAQGFETESVARERDAEPARSDHAHEICAACSAHLQQSHAIVQSALVGARNAVPDALIEPVERLAVSLLDERRSFNPRGPPGALH